MNVNICGIKHEIVETEDTFTSEAVHLGEIHFKDCKIFINKDMHEDMKAITICHEMVHGMLTHLGYQEQSNDEQFVQALAMAIWQGFTIKEF